MKSRQNFSIDENILKEFKKMCRDKSINMSSLIQKMIESYIKENN